MDNMAYLQQIAVGGNKNVSPKSGGSDLLKKIFNKWTILIGVILLVLVIIAIVAAYIVSALNTVDTKDQDLMTRSYWAAEYLNEETFNTYASKVKNSDIRSMTASLRSVLNEIILNEGNLMLSEFEIKVKDTKKSDIATEELNKNTTLNATLEEGRLNGILDRTFLREITMQIAYLISYQSECAERTKNNSVKEFSEKAKLNLQNLYDQFYNFSSPTI